MRYSEIISKSLVSEAAPVTRNRLYNDRILGPEYQHGDTLPKYAMRNISGPDELNDIIQSGYVRARNDGGDKYFTMTNRDTPPEGNQGGRVIRIPSNKIPNGYAASARDVELWNDEKKVWEKLPQQLIEEIEYRGHTFPGYNKPIRAPKGDTHKKMVLVKRGDKIKLVKFGLRGMEDYTQHKDKERRKNYLARSAGIRNKDGKLTKDDPFSANYWARRELW